jgi:hypothetical protein
MERAVGSFLGILLARVIVPEIFGPVGELYFVLGSVFLVFLLMMLMVWHRYKMRRLSRKFCDDAIFYAKKKRKAFDDPDYSNDELSAIRRARKKGDVALVRSIIFRSDEKVRKKKASEESLIREKKQKEADVARRRSAEIGLYRA